MDTESVMDGIAKLMAELEQLRDLRDAVAEYVDYIGRCNDIGCGCTYCDMVKALEGVE